MQNASGNEDSAISLSIDAALVDTDGSETLSIAIGGVPANATLSAGTDNGNGSWSLTKAQLAGLSITPPPNFSGTFELTVKATSTENGGTASTPGTLVVTVNAVPDAPTLVVEDVARGEAGTPIPLNISVTFNDPDESEIHSVTIDGVPLGATLSHGFNLGGGTWGVDADQLAGLTITVPESVAGTHFLTVTASNVQLNPFGFASQVGHIALTVDSAILTAHDVAGNEDTPIPLAITTSLRDVELDVTTINSIILSGMPIGTTLNKGLIRGDGTSWSLRPSEVTGLTLTPPHDFSGTMDLTITAITVNAGSNAPPITRSIAFKVTVAGVADAPIMGISHSSGLEDSAIGVHIGVGPSDPSETVSVNISSDAPAGAVFNQGNQNADGSWTLSPAQLNRLTITPPPNYTGEFRLTIVATSTDGTSTATTLGYVYVTVNPAADPPTLSVQPAAGDEDTPIALNIGAAPAIGDESATFGIAISGVPTGAALNQSHQPRWRPMVTHRSTTEQTDDHAAVELQRRHQSSR